MYMLHMYCYIMRLQQRKVTVITPPLTYKQQQPIPDTNTDN